MSAGPDESVAIRACFRQHSGNLAVGNGATPITIQDSSTPTPETFTVTITVGAITTPFTFTPQIVPPVLADKPPSQFLVASRLTA